MLRGENAIRESLHAWESMHARTTVCLFHNRGALLSDYFLPASARMNNSQITETSTDGGTWRIGEG